MPLINFPADPVLNQEYTFGDKTWVFNGNAWALRQDSALLLDMVKAADGPGSGLDADLLDGQHASFFYPASNPSGYGAGTVTSVGTGTGLSGGPITGEGTIGFAVPDVGTWAASPSSANLAAAVNDETGSGSLVFANTPTLQGPIVGGAKPFVEFADGSATSLSPGRAWYNASTGSWNFGMGGGNITQQVGEEFFKYGKATAAISDANLQLIYTTGTVGASGVVTFAPTIANVDDNSIIGIATEPIPLNGFGRVTTMGTVRGIDTTGTFYGEVWADNDVLWYNPVTGGLTKVKPVAPYAKCQVGKVIHAGNGGSGSFDVEIIHGTQLGGTDSNVQLASVADKHLLQYSADLGHWVNAPLSSNQVTTALGFTPYSSTNPSGYINQDGNARVAVALNSTSVGTRRKLNFIQGSNITLGIVDDAPGEEVDITIGSSSQTVDIQEFSSPGTSTWIKPAGAKMVHVLLFAGGGGGGSGAYRNTATQFYAGGGPGGGAGGRLDLFLPAAMLLSTVSVVVGAGGAGGVTFSPVGAGAAGSDGGNTVFGSGADTYATALGGRGGAGVPLSQSSSVGTLSGGASLYDVVYGTAVFAGLGASSDAQGLSGGFRPGGGGAGGSVPQNTTAATDGKAGGQGGASRIASSSSFGGGGGGGVVSGNGSLGSDGFGLLYGGSGGGGGGGGSPGAGGAGGAGGFPGGGGGGGGGTVAFPGGSGGAGGKGYARITTFF